MRKKLPQSSTFLQESRKKRQHILKRKVLIYSSLFLVGFMGLILIAHWSKLNIKSVEVTGDTVADAEAIKSFVQSEVAGSYLFMFPKSNFLIYPKTKILKDLAKQFAILKDITINLKGVNTLAVGFSEREGKYTWCGNALPMDTTVPEQCYFMDDSGYIFGPAPYFSGGVYLKFYGDIGQNTGTPLGSNFALGIFPQLITFRNSVQNMGIKTSAFFLKPDASIELYLSSSVPFPNKPKIVFNSTSNVDTLAENLQTALSTDPLQTDFNKKLSSLQYIDLRYGNKVYYKFN